jgi:hypothetical protein
MRKGMWWKQSFILCLLLDPSNGEKLERWQLRGWSDSENIGSLGRNDAEIQGIKQYSSTKLWVSLPYKKSAH